MKYNEEDTTLCGGSLVSNTHVITAAHCLTMERVLDSVVLGETDIRKEIGEVENEMLSEYLVKSNFKTRDNRIHSTPISKLKQGI